MYLVGLLAAGQLTPAANLEEALKSAVSRCAPSAEEEVLVCGNRRDGSPYRLPKLANEYEQRRIRAEKQLAPNLSSVVRVEPVTLPGGIKSNRVMLTFGLKF